MSKRASKKQQDRARWELSLKQLLTNPEDPVIILTIRRGWNSASRPVLARGIDKYEYIVKGKQAGRQIINDQIVARLGLAMGAPVGEPEIVEISPDPLDVNFSFLSPGKAHATRFIANCFDDRDTIKYKNHEENRPRFALLSVLFGWVYSQDQQFIYQKNHPNLVYSVDHGHFFPGGHDWTVSDITSAPTATVDKKLVSSCELTDNEIRQALIALEEVTEETIVQAVASPPDEWGITMEERVAMVEYLMKRQQELLNAL